MVWLPSSEIPRSVVSSAPSLTEVKVPSPIGWATSQRSPTCRRVGRAPRRWRPGHRTSAPGSVGAYRGRSRRHWSARASVGDCAVPIGLLDAVCRHQTPGEPPEHRLTSDSPPPRAGPRSKFQCAGIRAAACTGRRRARASPLDNRRDPVGGVMPGGAGCGSGSTAGLRHLTRARARSALRSVAARVKAPRRHVCLWCDGGPPCGTVAGTLLMGHGGRAGT
jgi:hypothetical protein